MRKFVTGEKSRDKTKLSHFLIFSCTIDVTQKTIYNTLSFVTLSYINNKCKPASYDSMQKWLELETSVEIWR